MRKEKQIKVMKVLKVEVVCLFLGGFTSHLKIFHSYDDITITGEGFQILTLYLSLNIWPLSSEGSLTYHTYYDTEHPLIMVTSEDL